MILYELLTGSLPRGTFELPSHRVAVDVRLDEIVLKALEREPARRHQHALEVKGDVETLGPRVRRRSFVARATRVDAQRLAHELERRSPLHAANLGLARRPNG